MKLLFLLLPFLCVAQTYQYTYVLTYKQDTLQERKDKLRACLEIDTSEKAVRFFEKTTAEYDSLIVNEGKSAHITSNFYIAVKKKLNEERYDNFLYVNPNYYTFSTTDKMDWKLEQETKTIDGYEVQKATTSFGGRHWTAWFCKDIPFFEGPYKFHGLPGLIFEVYDSQNYFHFLLQKGQKISWKSNSDRVTEKLYGVPAIKISEKQFIKLKLDFYNHPIPPGNWQYGENGKVYSSSDDPDRKREYIKIIQNRLKRYNHQIDKRFMIDYE